MARKKTAEPTQQEVESNSTEPSFEIEEIEQPAPTYEPPEKPSNTGLSKDELEIDPTHPGWTRYILDQLAEDEQYDGNPKSDGLRRLVEKNIGPIISFETKVHSFPLHGEDNKSIDNTASVTTTIKVYDNKLKNVVSCQASADANSLSCMPPFSYFLTSIAETRAECRAYRKLLRLKNVVAAEELGRNDPVVADRISDTTVMAIGTKCQRMNINVKEFVLFALDQTTKDSKITSIRKLSTENGRTVLERVRKLEKYLDDNDNKLPENLEYLKTFDENWPEYFG